MIDQIAGTQADIERQLSELRQPANGRADPALISQLSSRLTALNALRQTVGSVAAADLAQLQAVVSAQVAASDAGIAQANGMMSDTPDGNAGYQAATAALDRKVAPLLALDASHNNEAHDMARSEGVDLSAFDAERDDLRKQRDRAVASGDKVGERQADWLMAQNTYNAMVAVGDGITDPAARARYDQEIAEQKKTADDLRLAYIEQLEAKAQQKAQDQHLPPSVVADYVTDNIARADARAATLHADDHQEAVSLDLQLAVQKAQATAMQSEPPPALANFTPETHEAVKQAAATITAGFDSFASSLSLTSPASQIALATTPDAHTTVEVPPVARAGGNVAARG